jgi:hypothetical protein
MSDIDSYMPEMDLMEQSRNDAVADEQIRRDSQMKIEDLKILLTTKTNFNRPLRLGKCGDRFALITERHEFKEVLGNVLVPVGGWLSPTVFYNIEEICLIEAFNLIRREEELYRITPVLARSLYVELQLSSQTISQMIKRYDDNQEDLLRYEQEQYGYGPDEPSDYYYSEGKLEC